MMKPKERDLEDILASDDEFPDDYVEHRDLPAYKDDTRFDKKPTNTGSIDITFDWIEDFDLKEYDTASSSCLSEDGEDPEDIKHENKKFIMKGVLSKDDIFCLKCVSTICSDQTFLWFVNFLMNKDLQSDYKFLKSCLVADIHDPLYKDKAVCDLGTKKYKYEIVVKI